MNETRSKALALECIFKRKALDYLVKPDNDSSSKTVITQLDWVIYQKSFKLLNGCEPSDSPKYSKALKIICIIKTI